MHARPHGTGSRGRGRVARISDGSPGSCGESGGLSANVLDGTADCAGLVRGNVGSLGDTLDHGLRGLVGNVIGGFATGSSVVGGRGRDCGNGRYL